MDGASQGPAGHRQASSENRPWCLRSEGTRRKEARFPTPSGSVSKALVSWHTPSSKRGMSAEVPLTAQK